jgi:hypothetical protein
MLRRVDFEKVRNSEIPLDRYFPEPISRPTEPPASDGKGTRQYLAWTRNDRTVGDLLKRYYGNVEFLKCRPTDAKRKADFRYLAFLLMMVARSMKK